ncbi:hypothetical protein, partial [Pyxidicoccus fallax]
MRSPARSWSPLLLALVLAISGCRCGDEPGLGGTREGFRPQEASVSFGRVLEGTQARRQVTLLATGRGGLTVTAAADAPFSVAAPEVSVPGSGTATVEVVFTAGNGDAQGTLLLVGNGTTESVRLTGTGVRPTPCPAARCRESRFDVESGTCIESVQPDGATCIPDSLCQENGRCEAGACVGTPRSCNDDNPCTVDSCSPTQGCVTSQVACPVPSNPCKVGVCEREEGCTEVDAEDLTSCGPFNCKDSNVCFSGSCVTVPTPEGTVCSPATACQGEGTCEDGACVRPDAGDLEFAFRQELGGEPVAEDGGPMLLVWDEDLFTSVCGGDAGCRLVSYTADGFLRFESLYPDGGARTLLAASDAGVVVLAEEGLEGYAPRGDGERLWEAPWTAMGPPDAGTWRGETGAGRVALTGEGDVLAYVDWRRVPDSDGGVDLDGGTVDPLPPETSRLVWLTGRGGDAGTDAGALSGSPVDAWSGEARRAQGARLHATSVEAWPGEAQRAQGASGVMSRSALREAWPGEAQLAQDMSGVLLRATPVEAWPGEARLALDVSGVAFLYSTDGRLARVEDDGGTAPTLALVVDGGVPDGGASLAVAGGTLLVGATAFVPMDGGAAVRVDWDAGARMLVPLAEPALLPPEGTPGYLFA